MIPALRTLWTAWRDSNWTQRSALLRALCAVSVAWAALRLFPFRQVVTASMPPARKITDRRGHGRIIWAVTLVSQAVLPTRPCLPQSLATRYLLARAGCATELHIGVRRAGDTIGAHAWLERDGKPLINTNNEASFVPLRAPVSS